jgi:hypothetical protein
MCILIFHPKWQIISIDKKCPLKAMMFDVYYNLKNIKHADHMKCIYAYIERS